MADSEGYAEDVVSIPTAGMDGERYGDGLTDPGLTNKFPLGSFDVTGDHGPNMFTDVNLTLGENDFPRQKGSDSLSGGESYLS